MRLEKNVTTEHFSTIEFICGLILGGIFLCLPAYYNILPLWFRDTSAYMDAGFNNVLSGRVVWVYGAFLRHVSLNESLWLVIFSQGLLLTSIIYYCFKYVFLTKIKWHYLFYTIFVSMTTAISFHSSYLMPDVFTPIMILSSGLLLFVPTLTKRDTIILSILLFVAVSMHNTHWGILCALVIFIGIGALSQYIRFLYKAVQLSWKRVLLVVALLCSSYLVVSSIHYSLGGTFKATRGSEIYLFSRLWDYDLAQSYLDENCTTIEHPICGHRATLMKGDEYLWGNSPASLMNQGGWSIQNDTFFAALNHKIFAAPNVLKRYIIKNIENTFIQMLYAPINPTCSDRTDDLITNIEQYFPAYVPAAKNSRQYTDNYKVATITARNQLQFFILLISLILLLFALLQQKLPPIQMLFTLFIIISLFANALVIVSFWGGGTHLQSRVTWMLTLPASWLLFRVWDNWRITHNLPLEA